MPDDRERCLAEIARAESFVLSGAVEDEYGRSWVGALACIADNAAELRLIEAGRCN